MCLATAWRGRDWRGGLPGEEEKGLLGLWQRKEKPWKAQDGRCSGGGRGILELGLEASHGTYCA